MRRTRARWRTFLRSPKRGSRRRQGTRPRAAKCRSSTTDSILGRAPSDADRAIALRALEGGGDARGEGRLVAVVRQRGREDDADGSGGDHGAAARQATV